MRTDNHVCILQSVCFINKHVCFQIQIAGAGGAFAIARHSIWDPDHADSDCADARQPADRRVCDSPQMILSH